MNLPILLVESNALVRQVVALTATSLALGPVHQAASIQTALRLLQTREFSATILPLHSEGDEVGKQFFSLLEALRAGTTPSDPAIPVVITASACNRDEASQLLALNVQRVLIKPFKTRTLIDVLGEIAALTSASVSAITALA